MGYHLVGFSVIGVDLSERALRRYPFPCIRADAAWFIREHGWRFDVIHASPPCKVHTALQVVHGNRKGHLDLIPETRKALISTGRPWVIENVPRAPLIDPVQLCGSAFGMGARCRDGNWRQLRRHRLFESNIPLSGTVCAHARLTVGVYGHGGHVAGQHGYQANKAEAVEALGIHWMTRDGLSQSIPPVYTRWIGTQMMMHLMTEGTST